MFLIGILGKAGTIFKIGKFISMEFNLASDIQKRIKEIIKKIDFPHMDVKKAKNIVCFRSYGSKSRARARIWSLPSIWQKALQVQPHYCIEVLSEKFDKLSAKEQTKTLIHELMHIPKTFSGALLPHRGRGRVRIDNREVDKLYKKITKSQISNKFKITMTKIINV